MGANHVGREGESISLPKLDLNRITIQGVLAEPMGSVTKNRFQPITSRGYGEHWELYAT